jgi:catechol 2,3-dioxygenase-like lactoylglutathione lyase family enzyme
MRWFILAILSAVDLHAQPTVAPAGRELSGVWHLGRVTGDLERIIAFYHDLLGLDLRGARNQRFQSNVANNEFVNAPADAEFRAAFLPIPGTSAATAPADRIYLEAFEYRNVDRRQFMPALTDLGVSTMRFFVRDLDATIAAAKSADIAFVTRSQTPVADANHRAILVRDPDGYPIELVQATPFPSTFADAQSKILNAHISVIVRDLDASVVLYRQLIGLDANVAATPWQPNVGFSQLRNLSPIESRTATIPLPGSLVQLELMQLRGVPQAEFRPTFQDIGFGHIAFLSRDIEKTFTTMQSLGLTTLSKTGTFTTFSPTLRAVYTRDRDGFFLEIIERK